MKTALYVILTSYLKPLIIPADALSLYVYSIYVRYIFSICNQLRKKNPFKCQAEALNLPSVCVINVNKRQREITHCS